MRRYVLSLLCEILIERFKPLNRTLQNGAKTVQRTLSEETLTT